MKLLSCRCSIPQYSPYLNMVNLSKIGINNKYRVKCKMLKLKEVRKAPEGKGPRQKKLMLIESERLEIIFPRPRSKSNRSKKCSQESPQNKRASYRKVNRFLTGGIRIMFKKS
jgi:hypothetical protein